MCTHPVVLSLAADVRLIGLAWSVESLERMLEAFIKDTRPELPLAEVSKASHYTVCVRYTICLFFVQSDNSE